MNRRELLQRIPLLSVVPFLKPDSLVTSPEYPATYRGFDLSWSGWMRPTNICMDNGYWFALNPDRTKMCVYSAYPGSTAKCWPGFMMDIHCHRDQTAPGPWSTPVELESYRADAYVRLIRYLDRVYEELS